jgi:hypothetical protein
VPAKLVIGDRTQAVLLLVEGPGMGEILDLAIAFHAESKMLAELVLQPPIDFELEAVDLRLVADLPDEESIDRG